MITVEHISKSYLKGGLLSKEKQLVLNDVSFKMLKGECLGIIGESGSGKSTLGRLILGIEKPDKGQILIYGENVQNPKVRSQYISAVFQDYSSSINPRYTVEDAIREPLSIKNKSRKKDDYRSRIIELLEQVGLNECYLNRYPHELSGGEAQRVCIVRAISTEPEFLLLDEAISSLDVSVQTQILDLLINLKEKFGMSYLFITHDIQAVAYICNRVLFFNHGQVIETSAVSKLHQVKEMYSKKLLSVVMPI